MNKILGIALVVAVLSIIMVSSGFVTGASASLGVNRGGGHCEDLYAGHWTFDWDFTAGTILSIINLSLAAVLLTVYIGIYRRTGTQFNLMLIIIALTLFCFSIVANPLVSAVLGYEASGLGPFFILPDIFALAALSSLLYLSLKY
jgi:hypothetical protein